MGRTSKDAQIIVSNIVNVIRQLAELVIPETEARQTLREALRMVTTCLRKADGLELVFIREASAIDLSSP
ncbi:hypothetical protein HPB50_023474 [Hyalomma asiaticum]|uniref:Uncharacterized protein n=1 Tax=Hyalomma asiaticum TaxID=266040 RepID=A0ACB7RKX8_HYAAI|nr:hypothetical protein HPB50_023474 [Hyalomma asiaticum]